MAKYIHPAEKDLRDFAEVAKEWEYYGCEKPKELNWLPANFYISKDGDYVFAMEATAGAKGLRGCYYPGNNRMTLGGFWGSDNSVDIKKLQKYFSGFSGHRNKSHASMILSWDFDWSIIQ